MNRKGIVASVLLFMLTVYLVGSVTRIISASHDNMDALICNSNGNCWEPEGANIQTAIDGLNVSAPHHAGYGGAHGTVWLPANTILTIPNTLVIENHVTLDMRGATIRPQGNFDVVELRIGSQLRDGIIDVSSVTNFNSAAITLRETDYMFLSKHTPRVFNMHLVSENLRGKGIYLHTEGTDAYQTVIAHFHNIKTREFEYGILINHTSTADATYLNANMFSNIEGHGDKYFITLYESNPEVAGHYFQNVRCYCSSDTEYIVWANGQGNTFDNFVAYDWDNNGGTRASYNFSSEEITSGTPAYHFFGSDQCYLSIWGGEEDLDFASWAFYDSGNDRYRNRFTLLELKNSNLTLGQVKGTG